jgi:Tfp pilus assembly protein PilP
MTPARAATYFAGASLLAVWLASAAGVVRSQPPRPARRSAESIQLDSAVVNVQAQASRLRQRLAAAPSPQTRARNPFTFGARERATTVATTGAPAPPRLAIPEETPLAEPPLVLIGIAEDGATRTAMIESSGELLMATEGQTLGGRYRVAKVGADALELEDLGTGAIRRLYLKSPALPL